mmetsp:Transcript_70569/g.188031  ORF Transcript_70569/g.188031 Transcript_70569/m.188031 type:complete len:754 (+) Transcript_70569:37-2298(+)
MAAQLAPNGRSSEAHPQDAIPGSFDPVLHTTDGGQLGDGDASPATVSARLDRNLESLRTAGEVGARQSQTAGGTGTSVPQKLPGNVLDPYEEWCRKAFASSDVPDEITVLLLGQTGSGKSSFLNLLGNFPAVLRHGAEAVRTHMKDFRDLTIETDVKNKQVSQTNAATVYRFPIGPVNLRVVDTPGFGDTRGRDLDAQHAKRIVDCVQELETVHAIAIVISGREARMTAQLKYALSEVCAILPKAARSNVIVVFTNTSSPLYLTFDVAAVNSLVEHQVHPQRQVFIENPYVLWERSMRNFGAVDDVAMQEELVKAFKAAGGNLGKFYSEVIQMPQLLTDQFAELYNLRMEIERTTMQILTELSNAQERQTKLAQKEQEVEHAATEEEACKMYSKVMKGTRWVFNNAKRHGTFCGKKDCHSNCHAPCKMDKVMDNAKFKKCSAFGYQEQEVTLTTSAERAEFAEHFEEIRSSFCTDEDGGDGVYYMRVLSSKEAFTFLGVQHTRHAGVWISGWGWANWKGLMKLKVPATVTVSENKDQNFCRACGHHRKYHYHDEKVWVQEEYTEAVEDHKTKGRYEQAKSARAQKSELVAIIREQILACEQAQEQLGQRLVLNIRKFEQHGLSRNYAMLLQNQRDLLQQHIEATLEAEAGADVSALRRAVQAVQQKLDVVARNLRGSTRNPLEWAFAMFGLSQSATAKEVQDVYEQECLRMDPNSGGGNPDRAQQLSEALRVLQGHFKNSVWRPALRRTQGGR